eukprot:1155627-Pelagomonas_calceolata.AAC.2
MKEIEQGLSSVPPLPHRGMLRESSLAGPRPICSESCRVFREVQIHSIPTHHPGRPKQPATLGAQSRFRYASVVCVEIPLCGPHPQTLAACWLAEKGAHYIIAHSPCSDGQ